MARVILPYAIIEKMSIREINRHFRYEDESDKWPICGKFNVTERAIRRVRKQIHDGLAIGDSRAYYLILEQEIGRIVNDEKNW